MIPYGKEGIFACGPVPPPAGSVFEEEPNAAGSPQNEKAPRPAQFFAKAENCAGRGASELAEKKGFEPLRRF